MPSQPRGSSRAGQPCGSTIRRASAGREHVAAARERVRREAHAPGLAHGLGDLARRPPGVRDLPIDAEGEVVACLRADLGPHEHEDAVVPALPAVAARRQGVVIGQQHGVGAGGRRRRDDLVDRGRAVGVGAVHVHHAGHIDRGRRALPSSRMRLRLLAPPGPRGSCCLRSSPRPSCSPTRPHELRDPRRSPAGVAAPVAALVAWVLLTPALFPGTCSPPPAGWRSAPWEERCSPWAARCSEGWRPSRSRARPRRGRPAARAAQSQARARQRAARAAGLRGDPGRSPHARRPGDGPALRRRRIARPLRRVHGRDRDRRARAGPPPTPCSGRVWRPARPSPSRWPSFPSRSAARAAGARATPAPRFGLGRPWGGTALCSQPLQCRRAADPPLGQTGGASGRRHQPILTPVRAIA